jgi:Legume-like lectin family
VLISAAGMTVLYWDFMGSTMVTNNYIRLTPDLQSKEGAIWNTVVSAAKITTYLIGSTKNWVSWNF